MVNEKTLFAAGYKKYASHKSKWLYQKRFLDAHKKTKYFIEFYCWDLSDFNPNEKNSFSVEARLYRNDFEFDITLHWVNDKSIEQCEKFIEDAWKKLDCINDTHNNS